ncbi:stage V sporulation protein AB [Aeribacillus pallidus]|jgi:stage V sporulation protein AB|uniref:stage V sporulation protein AB n=1 Tax=Aeribacillus pallidus TaxID=33936 RepID=UPI001D9860B5|nr:stage V sporulation protein AB [Bacillus sp. (in: firmicutes)]
MTIKILIIAFIGFAGGLAVGAGFVAFLTVLSIIPRLTQLTKTSKFIHVYEGAVILGAISGSISSLWMFHFHLPSWTLIPLGLGNGVFIGMLAAGLTEALNVLPILAKRIGVEERLLILLMAIVLGKMFGSLFQWMFFVKTL